MEQGSPNTTSKIPATPDIAGKPLCIYCGYKCNRGIIDGNPQIYDRTFGCIHCCSAFSARIDLSRHLMTHTKERPHKCTKCEYRTDEKRFLTAHMKDKHLMCVYCNPFQTFVTKTQSDRHWEDYHGVLNKAEHHIESKHLKHPTAETATKNCENAENLENKIDVADAKKPPGTNQSHQQNCTTVNTIQEQPSTSEILELNTCMHCNYNCKRGIMSNNPEISSGKFIFDCNYCCSKFLQKKDLEDHVKTHTKNTKERPYKCAYCNYRTTAQWKVESHQLDKHVPTTCYICYRKFASARHMKRHVSKYHLESEHVVAHSKNQHFMANPKKQSRITDRKNLYIVIQ